MTNDEDFTPSLSSILLAVQYTEAPTGILRDHERSPRDPVVLGADELFQEKQMILW